METTRVAHWLRRRLRAACLCLASVTVLAPPAPAAPLALPASNRLTVNLGASAWRYNLTDDIPASFILPTYDDSAWPTTGIPHSPNESNMFTNWESGGGAGFMQARVWYRKHFTLDPRYAGRKVLVEFEGAHTGVQVYINGHFLPGSSALNPQATHVVGFLPFVVDLTPYAKFDGSDNVLAVKTAGNGDFFANPDFSGGYRFGQGDTGLFRPVSMTLADPVHIPHNVWSTLRTWGTYVATRAADRNAAAIHVETNIVNESTATKDVTLTTRIVNQDGAVVAESVLTKTLAPNAGTGLQTNKYEQELTLANPTLWYPNNSPAGGPYLYRVFHIVSVGGAVVDATETPLGIRIITWNNDYPMVNGVPMSLWGGSGRYDYPALGTAVPEEQQWRDLQLLAAAGGSLYRPGHSSSSAEFVAAADALGILLMQPSGDGENGFGADCDTVDCGQALRDKQTLKTELHQEMVYRDRNNPSILAWEANNGTMDPTLAARLKALSNSLEAVPAGDGLPAVLPRPQTNRDATHPENGDFLSCTRQSCETNLKLSNPAVPTWNAESWGGGGFREGYDYEMKFVAEYMKDWSQGVQAKAFGLAQWYLADTPGETGEQADGTDPALVRGIADSMLDQNRLPKLMYYAYQAAWTPYALKPVVRLAHHWNRSGLVRMNAFSNCPAVRLKVNGVQVGDLQVPNPLESVVTDTTQATTQLPYQVHWDNVQWQAGTVSAECLDSVDQYATAVASDQRQTAGPADHLELVTEPGLVRPDGTAFQVTANGSDAAFITARVVDAAGIVVPTADNNLTFAVSALGNYRGGTQQRVTPASQLFAIGYLSATELADYNEPTSANNATVNLKVMHYHAPDSAELQAEGGLQRIAVRSRFTPGTVTVSATAAGLGSAQATFTVVPVPTPATQDGTAPVLVTQPAAQLISAGEQGHFSATASGAAPLAFQWSRNGVALPGATASSYTTPVTTLDDSGSSYTVLVTNGVGSAQSNSAALQVVAPVPPAIVTAPLAVTVPVGQVASFTVQSSGSPTLLYQWLRNGAAIAGATGASYTTAAVTAADDGAAFSVTVTNAVGSASSAPALLTVSAASKPVFTLQPLSKVVQLGQSVTLAATASGSAPMHFDWKNGATTVSSVDVNTGGGSTSYTISAVKASDLGNYTVEAHNAANLANEVVASAIATLTEAPPGDNLALNKPVTATSFENAGAMPATALTDGGTLTRWSSAVGVDDASFIVDLNTPETFNRMILRWEAAYASQYRIDVSNDKDDPASWQQVHLETQGAGQTDDFSFASVAARYVRLTGIQRATAYGYSLFEVEIYNVPGCGSNERYDVLDADNVLDHASGLTWQRRPYTLADQGAQFTQPVAQAYCAAKGMRLPTKAEATNISKYNTASCAFPTQWTSWTSTLVENDPVYAYTLASDGTVGQGLATNAPGAVLCVSGSTPLQAPAITLQPVAQTVAAGQSAQFNVAATGSSLLYNWYKNGALVSSSSLPGFVTPVAVAADNGSSYTVTVKNVAGEVTSQPALLTVAGTVNPGGGDGGGAQPPAATPTIATQPAGQTVLLGASATFTVAATGSGTLTYQWYRDGVAVAGAVGASVTTPAVTLDDNGASYTVLIGSSAGTGTITSQAATLLVQDGATADDVNLALGQSVTASGIENVDFGKAANAVDGDDSTRWASDVGNDAAWITVDLGATRALTKVQLDWEAAYGKQYLIQVSTDGVTFKTVYTQSSGRGGIESLSFPVESARYVRMQGVLRSTQYGYSLFEFKVYGPKLSILAQPLAQTVVAGQAAHFAVTASASAGVTYQWYKNGAPVQTTARGTYDTPAVTMADNGAQYRVTVSDGSASVSSAVAVLTVTADPAALANLAAGKAVTSSGVENTIFGLASNAVDGDATTRWASNFADDAWITVDLGAPTAVSQVVLNWENAYGARYLIQVSSDGLAWTTVLTQDAGKGGIEQLSFATTSARYVRLQGVARATQYGYSLYELQIYGAALASTPPATAPATPTASAPVLANQPASVSVLVGQVAHFAVAVTDSGNGPFTYQWSKNGRPVDGATAAAYDTPAAVAADNGAVFTVTVTNAGGVVTSAAATLTVTVGGGSGDYTVYPGFVGVELQNNTGGVWRDDQVYITVLARNPATGHFSYLKPDGTIVEGSVAANDATGHLTKDGVNYANMAFTLADSKLLMLPQLDSGRLFVSLGSPVYIRFLLDGNQDIGYAGPNVLNPTDPNTSVYFDWYEFTYNGSGLWMNSTQVDQFGFPLVQDVYGANHTFHQRTGITESRAALFDAYNSELPAAYLLGTQSPYRLLAPAKTTFDAGQVNGTYFDAYVDQVWDDYRTTSLAVHIGGQKFTGQVNDANQFVFKEVDATTGAVIGGTYVVAGKPTTQDVFEGKGILATGNATELQIEAQLCAALNRHVAGDATTWATPAAFYGTEPANEYARFFHAHSVGGKAYGFAYDDVSDQSSTVQSPTPEHVVLGIGW